MKRYLIPTVAVLLVLVVAWTAFGQAQERGRQRGNMSEEQRAQMRERFANMSEEERAQMRQRGGSGRGMFTSPEAQAKAIKTIEEQLAKLKAAQITRPQGSFQDLSEDERAKLREKMMKTMQSRQQALQAIIAQVAALQGRRQPAAGAAAGQFLIINTSDLRPIQAAAKKEEAKETTQLLERLISRGSGRGSGGRARTPGAGQRPQGGQRGTRAPRPEGGGRQQRNR